ncbi:MAG TPA: hypothetical protein VNE62_05385 [Actinomycetota bacterium]|nr:hypothetical protein [Actinomycetota bacterium]
MRPVRLALIVLLLAAVVPASASAQRLPVAPAQVLTTPQLIERAVESGTVDRYTADLYLAYAIAAPTKLPPAFMSAAPWKGTLPLLELRERVDAMPAGVQRSTLDDLVGDLSPSADLCGIFGPFVTTHAVESAHFRVEYVPGTIGGGLTVEAYLQSLEGAWSSQVDEFGWAAPPLTGQKYLVRLDPTFGAAGLYGYVAATEDVGDNPNTTWNEGDAYASCMGLSSDYTRFPGTPQQALDATTAHEFNHSIQFGYGALIGSGRPDAAFSEGGATWMEDEVYDGADDNYNYLWPSFSDSMGAYGQSPYPYWITFRGLTERFGTSTPGGGEQVMQDFWEETSKGSSHNLTAMQKAMQNKGLSLGAAFHDYAIAVRFNRTCGGGYALPHCFEEAAGYVDAAAPPGAPLSAGLNGAIDNTVKDDYAIAWVRLPEGASYTMTLANRDSAGLLRGSVVCDTGTSMRMTSLPSVLGPGAQAAVSVDSGGCESIFAVITNEHQTAANPSSSSGRQFRLTTASS